MKAFLIAVLFSAFAVIGVVMLAGLGLIPQSLYSLVYTAEQSLGIGGISKAPYLQKFEGYWSIAFEPSIVESDIGKCKSVAGNIRVRDGKFSGSIGPFGSSVGIHASTTENGMLSGGFSAAGLYKGTFKAKLYGARGSGEWVDSYECRGTVMLVKLDPIIDPVQGSIVSMIGTVRLVRDGEARWVLPGQVLYVGDRVDVSSNSEAVVVMNKSNQKTTIPAGAGFTVPEPIPN